MVTYDGLSGRNIGADSKESTGILQPRWSMLASHTHDMRSSFNNKMEGASLFLAWKALHTYDPLYQRYSNKALDFGMRKSSDSDSNRP